MSKQRTYDDVLPYLHYEDGVQIYKNGRVCYGAALELYDYESFTASEVGELNMRINRVISELPDYANVQLLRWTDEVPSSLPIEEGEDVVSEALNDLATRKLLTTKGWIFIELMPKKYKPVDVMSTLLSKGGMELNANAFSGVDTLKQECLNMGNDLLGTLNGITGLGATHMSGADFERLNYQLANLDINGAADGYELELNNLDAGKLTLGEHRLSMISLLEQGVHFAEVANKPYLGEENSIIHPLTYPIGCDLQIPHLTVVNLRKVSKDIGLNRFRKELTFCGMLPDLRFFKKLVHRGEELDTTIKLLDSQPYPLCELGVNVLVWGDTAQEQRERLEAAKQALKRVENCRIVEESVDAANLFFAAFPGNGSQNFRRVLVPSLVGVGYLNFEGDYRSDSTGELMTDRFGNPLLFDYQHPDLNNQNGLKIGPPGSGKSMSEGASVLQALQRNEIVVIFDKGGSYRNLFNSLPQEMAKYLEHSEEKPFKLNPFFCPFEKKPDGTRKYLLDNDKQIILRTFIALLSKDVEKGEVFSTAESAVLIRLIPLYYKYAEKQAGVPTLKKFSLWLKDTWNELLSDAEKKELDVERLLIVLHPYTDGMYSQILNNEEEMDLGSYRALCFDLESIQKDKILFPIVAMLLIELVMQYIAKFPGVYKDIDLDEVWSFFVVSMLEFIEYMYRTIRKHNGRGNIISQNAGDIKKCVIGDLLIAASDVIYLLNHSGQNLELVKDVLELTDREIALVASMRKDWRRRNGERGGREIFIKRKNVDSRVYGVEIPIMVHPILTSNPKERNHFNKLRQSFEFNRAIEEWVKDKNAHVI